MGERLHFIGIGGIGMSALARIALARGVEVSGSNDRESATTQSLRAEGATVVIGHRPENIVGRPRVVVTSAVTAQNPELMAAREAGLEILGRGALLAELFNRTRGIAIAGTHGKTTVTGMTATILEHAGCDPTVAVGGLRRESGTNFRCGKSDWFVTESDESDGSFLALRPEIAVVLNLENDHITSDDGMVRLRDEFTEFIRHVPPQGTVIVGIDDPESAALFDLAEAAHVVSFGFADEAWIRGAHVRCEGLQSRCWVFEGKRELGELVLSVPGRMNLANALAATAVARALDIPFATIAAALAGFGGMRRRFDILSRSKRMIVVDDYAHHPTAVSATIAAARAVHDGPLIAVFQAHRYTRTAYLAADFARSLEGVDEVILTEIYAASEEPVAGVSAELIGEPLRATGAALRYVPRAELVATLAATVPEGALVLMLGAGDITAAAQELAQVVEAKVAQSVSPTVVPVSEAQADSLTDVAVIAPTAAVIAPTGTYSDSAAATDEFVADDVAHESAAERAVILTQA